MRQNIHTNGVVATDFRDLNGTFTVAVKEFPEVQGDPAKQFSRVDVYIDCDKVRDFHSNHLHSRVDRWNGKVALTVGHVTVWVDEDMARNLVAAAIDSGIVPAGLMKSGEARAV